MTTYKQVDPLTISLRLYFGQETIRWNPIATAAEDANVVHLEQEG